MTDTLVHLQHALKRFDNDVVAFRDLTLDISKGSFTSILGPSGCGKSTLLRVIARLISLSSGDISWNLKGNRPPSEEIGFVFQEPTLMPWANVRRNVALPLEMNGISPTEVATRVDAILDLVALTGFENAFPRELSGGMKMRASIARALVTAPDLLLMDEPFAALDEITREKLNDDLLNIWQTQKCSVIFVTHSVYESVYLSERIIVLSERPAHIMSDINIEAPFPRSREYRLSSQYTDYCRQVSTSLLSGIDAS